MQHSNAFTGVVPRYTNNIINSDTVTKILKLLDKMNLGALRHEATENRIDVPWARAQNSRLCQKPLSVPRCEDIAKSSE